MASHDMIVGGGADDFNLLRLIEIAQKAGVDVLPVLQSRDAEPRFSWDHPTGALSIDGEAIEARALFQRYDVFTDPPGSGKGLDRPSGWHTSLFGWGMSQPDVRLFNRALDGQAGLKPYTLTCAAAAGLAIPKTLISNDRASIEAFGKDAIVKPVAGGAYTRTVGKALAQAQVTDGLMPMPATIQEKLVYPEYRTFVIGRSLHVFRLFSQYVDYRPAQDNSMDYLGSEFPCSETVNALLALLDRFGCDYCACDFKSDPGTGAPVFLELNSGPMFAAFDQTADGALCKAIVDWHLAEQA